MKSVPRPKLLVNKVIFPICVVKNEEILHLAKYKGRIVFQGNYIKDEEGIHQLFPDQGSGASVMAASRIMDAIELSPGCAGGQSDAPQAYCQAEFGFGMHVRPTYVEIPHDMRPKSWSKFKDPVVPLKLALYGTH